MLNWWRVVRTMCALFFVVVSPFLARLHVLTVPYFYSFLLMGIYLLFLDLFTLLVMGQRRRLHEFFQRYKFWRFTIQRYNTTFRFFCPEATPENPVFIQCSGYQNWMPMRMQPEACNTGWWVATFELPVGDNEYIYRIGSDYRIDSGTNKKAPNRFGGMNSVIRVGWRLIPGARVQIRNISGQVLISVAGFVLAFGVGRTGGLPPEAVMTSILSIIFGLLYNFVFGGGIHEERHNGEPHVVAVSILHEEVIEFFLNLQVLSLIFALGRIAGL